MLCLPSFLCFCFALNMQACESWKVEEQARQPATSCHCCIQGPSRRVLKQDKYLARGFFSLSFPLR